MKKSQKSLFSDVIDRWRGESVRPNVPARSLIEKFRTANNGRYVVLRRCEGIHRSLEATFRLGAHVRRETTGYELVPYDTKPEIHSNEVVVPDSSSRLVVDVPVRQNINQ